MSTLGTYQADWEECNRILEIILPSQTPLINAWWTMPNAEFGMDTPQAHFVGGGHDVVLAYLQAQLAIHQGGT